MRNPLWLSLIASTVLLGSDRVEFFGTQADMNGSIAHSAGNPVIFYQDQVLSAAEMTYDRNTSIVEAKGSVNVFKANQYHAISDYARFDLTKNTRYSKPYYMFDQASGVWLSTEEAEGCENEIDLASGAVSGCNSTDPLWKIRFSSADYDTEAMWVNLYNARLEIEDVPVFYLPYFGYPTDRTRRSGLLIPSFGWSNSEGFYYQQPIYFAPRNWWDLELRLYRFPFRRHRFVARVDQDRVLQGTESICPGVRPGQPQTLRVRYQLPPQSAAEGVVRIGSCRRVRALH